MYNSPYLRQNTSVRRAMTTVLLAMLPAIAVQSWLFGAALLWHSMQGLQVVFEDYVRGRALAVCLAFLRLLHAVAALALAFAIWTLATGGAA